VFTSYERGIPASTKAVARDSPQRRMLLAGPAVALVTLVTALLTTDAAGVPLRDPDHVAGRRLAWVVVLVVMLIVVDVVARAARRSDTLWPSLSALVSVRRDRWNRGRGVAVASALVSFYVTYLAYRNLKSVVPLLRPGELFDEELGDLDRSLFAGHDPAVLMHTLLGTGVPTQILSSAYMFLFAFIPGSLALALVFSRDLQVGLYYTTAQSLNWVLGAASYFVLPSLGPIYVEPSAFANLPTSGVTHLQNYLLNQRLDFLHDPAAGGAAQSIAAFSSLHVSIFFTAAVAAHLLGLPRRVKTGAWILLGLTSAATIYFGWHYVLDDLGGLGIGAMALVLARALTGFDLRSARRASTPNPAPA
jgi:hypothetical protein